MDPVNVAAAARRVPIPWTLVKGQIDMQFADLRALLRLPVEHVEPRAGCKPVGCVKSVLAIMLPTRTRG
jgi:hypothetical protein